MKTQKCYHALGFSILIWVAPFSALAQIASIPGDYDHDCDVDRDDYAALQSCASGPAIPFAGDCDGADLDSDGDVDQSDFGIFQQRYSGTGHPAEPNCGCMPGQTYCSGTCINTLADDSNCGTCGNACAAGLTCQNGTCAACPEGAALCGGQCIDVLWDGLNCGACGNRCGPQEHCSFGQCEGVCIGCE